MQWFHLGFSSSAELLFQICCRVTCFIKIQKRTIEGDYTFWKRLLLFPGFKGCLWRHDVRFLAPCVRMRDSATQIAGKKKTTYFTSCSSSRQTNTCWEPLRQALACALGSCLYECYSPKAAIITDVQCTLVCLSHSVPFSCPLRNADYRLDLVTVQQCDDEAQNVCCSRLH